MLNIVLTVEGASDSDPNTLLKSSSTSSSVTSSAVIEQLQQLETSYDHSAADNLPVTVSLDTSQHTTMATVTAPSSTTDMQRGQHSEIYRGHDSEATPEQSSTNYCNINSLSSATEHLGDSGGVYMNDSQIQAAKALNSINRSNVKVIPKLTPDVDPRNKGFADRKCNKFV